MQLKNISARDILWACLLSVFNWILPSAEQILPDVIKTFSKDLSPLLSCKPVSSQMDCGNPGCCCNKGEKQWVVRTAPPAAQTRGKRKPEFLIIPSTEGNARAHSLQQVTSHGGWHWLLPTASFSCAQLWWYHFSEG